MSNLTVIEREGKKVLTTKQLAQVYEATEQQIQQNFNNHTDKFIKNKHYYLLQGEELREFKRNLDNIEVAPNVNKLYLWTERGANRHCKILDTEKAWEQFENLEETYFRVKEQKQLSAMDQLRLQYQVIEEHDKKIDGIEREVDDLKSNMPLFNVDCKELQTLVRKVGTKALGGYRSPAYKDNSLRGKIYADIQHQLKREFGVNRYEAIKRGQLETAQRIVSEYKAPTVLADEIQVLNNQISYEEVACTK